MKNIQEIAEQLGKEFRERLGDDKEKAAFDQQIKALVKAAIKSDFRLKRTIRDRGLSQAVLNNTIAELEKQKDIIEEQSRFKEELFASISHELRTPLHGILGMSHLMEKTEMCGKQKEYTSVIKGSADNLLVIINDILSFSQMNAGKVELVELPLFPATIKKEILGTLVVKAEAKNLDLTIDLASDVPVALMGDHTRLYQVLINLLNNSIKFTERGCVSLKVKRVVKYENPVRLEFEVKDTGRGIPEEKLNTIFKPFSRVQNQAGEVIEGAGLGLNIVKKLVSLMNGEISVQSEVGKGTCFKILLDFPLASASDLTEVDGSKDSIVISDSWQQKKVLMIEDNPANNLYALHLFEDWNIPLDIAETYAEGLRMLNGSKYDCILSDVKLPDGDGIELIRTIRSNLNAPNYQTPVVILTASANENEKIITKGISIQNYLSKPFRPIVLIKEMKKAFESNSDHANEEVASFTVKKQNKSVEYFASLNKSFGANEKIKQEMINIFLQQIPVTISKLDQSLEDQDYDAFYFEVHRIKSTINIIGLPHLLDITMILEKYIYEKSDLEKVAPLFIQFKEQLIIDQEIIEKEWDVTPVSIN